jgi:hypothetical protein
MNLYTKTYIGTFRGGQKNRKPKPETEKTETETE